MSDRFMKRERAINTGRGISYTDETPEQLAAWRAERGSDTAEEQYRFMVTFHRLRKVIPPLAADRDPWKLDWALDTVARTGPIEEAAMIEAMAACRAEGLIP